MNNRSTAFSYGLAALLIGDIHDNYSRVSLETRRNNMREKLSGYFVAESYTSTDSLLSYAVFRQPTLTVVTIDGVDSIRMGLELNRGFTNFPDDQRPYPANPFFVRNAVNIWGACSLSGCNMQGPLIVGGHSGGGGAAEVLAAYWRQMRPGAHVRCITFGAPRVGGRAHIQRLQTFDVARYMNFMDCIPFLPAHQGQGDFVRFCASAEVVRAWDEYRHVNTGMLLDGALIPAEYDDVIPDGSVNANDALNYFAGARESLNIGHARLSYFNALRSLAVRMGDLEYFDEDVIPPVRIAPRVPALANPIPQPPAEFVHEAAVRFNNQLPANRTRGIFKAEKRNGTWCVVCDDMPVDFFLSKISAKAFARNMNRAYKGWNNSLFADASSMITAMRNNFLGEM